MRYAPARPPEEPLPKQTSHTWQKHHTPDKDNPHRKTSHRATLNKDNIGKKEPKPKEMPEGFCNSPSSSDCPWETPNLTPNVLMYDSTQTFYTIITIRETSWFRMCVCVCCHLPIRPLDECWVDLGHSKGEPCNKKSQDWWTATRTARIGGQQWWNVTKYFYFVTVLK